MAKTRRKKKTEPAPEMSFAAWVRSKLIEKPTLDVGDLEAAAVIDKRSEKINDKQAIYQAKNTIRKRWGVEPEDMPRAKDGSLNMSGMIRLYIDKFGDEVTESKAKSYFETDGLELKAGQFANAKATYLRKKGHLDPNAGKGPRARHTTKKGRKPGRRKQQRQVRAKSQEQAITVDMLLQTKQYIEQVGGIEQARSLMTCIEEIQTLPKG